MKHYGIEEAQAALERWDGVPEGLAHVATSGNAVYRFVENDTPWILRLTDLDYRTPAQNEAEMRFLDHLRSRGARANVARPSRRDRLVECCAGYSASVLSWAPGVRVEPGSPHWNRDFMTEWGVALARLHRAAQSYEGPARWEWSEEGLIAEAPQLIPNADRAARDEFALVLSKLSALPRTRSSYGMTHADFAWQNFNFEPGAGITAFDFGNCCAHWFVSDIVISLSTLRRLERREAYRDWLLEGYRAEFGIEAQAWSARAWFMRLRVLYVYLSRLKKFGATPTDDERTTLGQLSALVGEHGGQEPHRPLADWL